jgi:hypothetical protein
MSGSPASTEALTITAGKDGLLRLSKGGWSLTIPASDLPKWIDIYRRLAKRKQGRYAHHYTPDIAAMEAAQDQIKRKA